MAIKYLSHENFTCPKEQITCPKEHIMNKELNSIALTVVNSWKQYATRYMPYLHSVDPGQLTSSEAS